MKTKEEKLEELRVSLENLMEAKISDCEITYTYDSKVEAEDKEEERKALRAEL